MLAEAEQCDQVTAGRTSGLLPAALEEKLLGEYGWRIGNARDQSHPVAQKRPNGWGLFDIYGNVWEWCQDFHDKDYYATSPADGPTGPVAGSTHLVRGGGYGDSVGFCRSAVREFYLPGVRSSGVGFRVVCEIAPQKAADSR